MNSSRQPHGGKKFLIAAAALRRDIERGRYAIGEKLVAAGELGKHYNVSKPPMERALQILKDEGWLVSYVGDGTYVQDWKSLSQEEQDISEPEYYEVIMTKLGTVYDKLDRMERRLDELESKHVNESSPQRDRGEPQGQ